MRIVVSVVARGVWEIADGTACMLVWRLAAMTGCLTHTKRFSWMQINEMLTSITPDNRALHRSCGRRDFCFSSIHRP